MSDCSTNCDFNASVIDSWASQTYKQRQTKLKHDTQYQREMKKVRASHICAVCKKYPGDAEYSFGDWKGHKYICFDCD